MATVTYALSPEELAGIVEAAFAAMGVKTKNIALHNNGDLVAWDRVDVVCDAADVLAPDGSTAAASQARSHAERIMSLRQNYLNAIYDSQSNPQSPAVDSPPAEADPGSG